MKGTHVSSPIIPNGEYPTHYSIYGKGGHKEVVSLSEMRQIPEARLLDGTICYVKDEDCEYQYKNGSWQIYSGIPKEELEKIYAEINKKSPLGHNHDDRYYTEGEIDQKLTELSNNIPSLDGYLTEPNADDRYALKNHTHDQYALKTDIPKQVDLSGYATKDELSNKQDKLEAGDNITIVGNRISATGEKVDLSEYVKKSEISELVPDQQVQSDWNESDESAKSFIKNKPDILTESSFKTINGESIVGNGDITIHESSDQPVASQDTHYEISLKKSLNSNTQSVVLHAVNNQAITDTEAELEPANDTRLGLIRTGYNEDPNGRNYAVKLEKDTDRAYVTVPWTSGTSESGEGISKFRSYVFARFEGAKYPTNLYPTGGTYDNPIPDSINGTQYWFDGIPSSDADTLIWVSSRIFYSDPALNTTESWSTPTIIADNPNMDVAWSASQTYPSSNPSDDISQIQDDGIWHNEGTADDIWMAIRFKHRGVWGQWAISRIKGEKGAQGEKGDKGDDGTSIKPAGTYDNPCEGTGHITSSNNVIQGFDISRSSNKNPQVGDTLTVTGCTTDPLCGHWIYLSDNNPETWIDLGQIKGEDGKSQYIHIKYAPTDNVSLDDMTEEPDRYIGICVDSNPIDPSTKSSYTWSLFRGQDGFGYWYFYVATTNKPQRPGNAYTTKEYREAASFTDENGVTWYDDWEALDAEHPNEYRIWIRDDVSNLQWSDPVLVGTLSSYQQVFVYSKKNTKDIPTDLNSLDTRDKLDIYLEQHTDWTIDTIPEADKDNPYIWLAIGEFNNNILQGYWKYVCLNPEGGNAFIDIPGLIDYAYCLAPEDAILSGPDGNIDITDSYPDPSNSQYVWTDKPTGVDNINRCEWYVVKTYNINTRTWNNWSEPHIQSRWGKDGVDGEGVQYIFYVTDGFYDLSDNQKPSNWTIQGGIFDLSYQNDESDYIQEGSGWTDDEVQLTVGQVQWMSKRRRIQINESTYHLFDDSATYEDFKTAHPNLNYITKKYWTKYSEPVLWNNYAKDGAGITFDLTDDTIEVSVDDENKASAGTYTTKAVGYNGTSELDFSLIGITSLNENAPSTIRLSYNDKTISVDIDEGTVLTDSYQYEINGQLSNGTPINTVLTVRPSRIGSPGGSYDLQALDEEGNRVSIITIDKNKNYSPSSIYVDLFGVYGKGLANSAYYSKIDTTTTEGQEQLKTIFGNDQVGFKYRIDSSDVIDNQGEPFALGSNSPIDFTRDYGDGQLNTNIFIIGYYKDGGTGSWEEFSSIDIQVVRDGQDGDFDSLSEEYKLSFSPILIDSSDDVASIQIDWNDQGNSPKLKVLEKSVDISYTAVQNSSVKDITNIELVDNDLCTMTYSDGKCTFTFKDDAGIDEYESGGIRKEVTLNITVQAPSLDKNGKPQTVTKVSFTQYFNFTIVWDSYQIVPYTNTLKITDNISNDGQIQWRLSDSNATTSYWPYRLQDSFKYYIWTDSIKDNPIQLTTDNNGIISESGPAPTMVLQIPNNLTIANTDNYVYIQVTTSGGNFIDYDSTIIYRYNTPEVKQGIQGAVMRDRGQWKPDVSDYVNESKKVTEDVSTIRYIDYVVYGDEYYIVKDNIEDYTVPKGETPSGTSQYWTKSTAFDFASFKELIAKNADIQYIDSKEIRLKRVETDKDTGNSVTKIVAGMTAVNNRGITNANDYLKVKKVEDDMKESPVRIWAGTDGTATDVLDVSDAPFNVREDGTLNATKANITGNIKAEKFQTSQLEVYKQDHIGETGSLQIQLTSWGNLTQEQRVNIVNNAPDSSPVKDWTIADSEPTKEDNEVANTQWNTPCLITYDGEGTAYFFDLLSSKPSYVPISAKNWRTIQADSSHNMNINVGALSDNYFKLVKDGVTYYYTYNESLQNPYVLVSEGTTTANGPYEHVDTFVGIQDLNDERKALINIEQYRLVQFTDEGTQYTEDVGQKYLLLAKCYINRGTSWVLDNNYHIMLNESDEYVDPGNIYNIEAISDGDSIDTITNESTTSCTTIKERVGTNWKTTNIGSHTTMQVLGMSTKSLSTSSLDSNDVFFVWDSSLDSKYSKVVKAIRQSSDRYTFSYATCDINKNTEGKNLLTGVTESD